MADDQPNGTAATGAAPIRLAVALTDTGWHPGAWREPAARPTEVFGAAYWRDLVGDAERGLIDFVTIEDALNQQSEDSLRPDERTDRIRGRLDAVLIAARVAPTTTRIGLIPSVTVTHTEPFHTSKAIATLDFVSAGRAGLRVQVSARPDTAAHFGRRTLPALPDGIDSPAGRELAAELLGETADYVEVVRRLWDSWEDDAEIRDAASGRFIDRTKLHYIDFEGPRFSVRGPSITPRPPQGQPIVAALGHHDAAHRLIARSADVGFATPYSAADATQTVAAIAAQRPADADPVRVYADLVVILDDTTARAQARRARLDDLAGAQITSDAYVFTGTAQMLADLLEDWQAAGLTGFRLRPAALPEDLTRITGELVAELRRRGRYPATVDPAARPTLRDILGLTRPVNRYATLPGARS